MKKKLVYICSPLHAASDEGIRRNMEKAKIYAEKVSKILNCRAVAPHAVLPDILDDNNPEERKIGLRFGLDLLKLCSKVVVCGNTVSKGMREEVRIAGNFGIPVVTLEELIKNEGGKT